MRKVINKRIRRHLQGVDLVADVTAVIAVNAGADTHLSTSAAHSNQSVAQGDSGERDQPVETSSDDSGPRKEEP